ncbi:SBBP repeat-containing protein [Cytophagaceae bacterium YF14B1]|uniref:SBBP repeat-containing protein n=1 Tax=Xanthocytophaga flava TaxID=3048013 RepID=A0AAE3QMU0_9BACT|nr:SBBP repeat-containing protein [Xanthocytophaga flavus]MDJ1479528.1 SBBP repeat-containing protein [Xanthocytophaga flavus]
MKKKHLWATYVLFTSIPLFFFSCKKDPTSPIPRPQEPAKPITSFASKATGEIYSQSVAVDKSGNTYVAGSLYGTGTFQTTVLSSAGNNDIFIAKYDSTGQLLWAKIAGCTGQAAALDIAIDLSGNPYITGYFFGSITFGTTTMTTHDKGLAMYVAKYNADGDLQWAQKASGDGSISAESIALDKSGNIYITGSFHTNATFGTITLTSTGYTVFIAKYTPSGTLLWVKTAGDELASYGKDIAVDNEGTVYITGIFKYSLTFGSTTLTSKGKEDVFIANFTTDGEFQWAKSAGNTEEDYGYSIALDGSSGVYIAGSFNKTITFDNRTLTSNGWADMFLVKYTTSGQVQWAISAGTDSQENAFAITTDPSGNVYATGYFYNTISFGNEDLTSNGSADIFVIKYNPMGNILWAKNAGGANMDHGRGIALDEDNNPYITGLFIQSAIFGDTILTSPNEGMYLWRIVP